MPFCLQKRVHTIIPLFNDELHIEIRATYAKTTLDNTCTIMILSVFGGHFENCLKNALLLVEKIQPYDFLFIYALIFQNKS